MRNLGSLILMVAFLLDSAGAQACFHYDRSHPYEVKVGRQHAFLFHDGKLAHLVVNADVEAPAAGGKAALPKRLAWVLPFPTMPAKYEEVDPKIFNELGDLFDPPAAVGTSGGRSKGEGAPRSATIRVHAPKVVGNYKIRPIEVLTDAADGRELNAWLSSSGFNAMPLDKQKPYLKKGAVFLAVEMKLVGKTRADLKPLHVAYAATDLEFPVRFTHDTRTFDLDLFVYVPYDLDQRVPESHFERAGKRLYDASKAAKRSPLRKLLGAKQRGYVFLFRGRGLNEGERKLAALTADPWFRGAVKE